jgi:hypothetical protein
VRSDMQSTTSPCPSSKTSSTLNHFNYKYSTNHEYSATLHISPLIQNHVCSRRVVRVCLRPVIVAVSLTPMRAPIPYDLPNEAVLFHPSKTGRERELIVPLGSIRPSSIGVNHLVVSIGVAGDAASGGCRVYEVDQSLNRLRGRPQLPLTGSVNSVPTLSLHTNSSFR